jgi:hypothetical protein
MKKVSKHAKPLQAKNMQHPLPKISLIIEQTMMNVSTTYCEVMFEIGNLTHDVVLRCFRREVSPFERCSAHSIIKDV